MYKRFYVAGVIFALTAFSSLASADILAEFHPGFYVDFEAGFGHLDVGSGLKDWANQIYQHYPYTPGNTLTTDEKNWALRGAFGYRFSPYFEVEGGYTYYPNSHYSAYSATIPGGGWRSMDMTLKGNTMDLAAKISFPLGGFAPELGDLAPYVKLGAIYVRNSLSGQYGGTNGSLDPVSHSISESHSAVRPLYGIGVAYHYSERVMFDVSWVFSPGKNKIGFASAPNPGDLPISNTNRSIASSSFFSFGIVYHWPLDR